MNTGPLPLFRNQYSDVLFITTVANNKFMETINCMYSMILADPYASILLIELGLSLQNSKILASHLVTMHQIQSKVKSNGILAYRKIFWRNYPTWMNIHKAGKEIRGGYAWKMSVISDAFFEWRGCIAWIENTSIFTEGISRELTAAKHFGVYSPRSSGKLGEWMHEDMKSFLLEHHFIRSFDPSAPNCMSDVLFIDYAQPFTHQFVNNLRECSFTRKCIAPLNSTIANHRFDQSLLSVLISDAKVPRAANSLFKFHPALHNQGIDSIAMMKNLMLLIEAQYRIIFTNEMLDTSNLKLSNVTMINTSRPLDFCHCLFYMMNSFNTHDTLEEIKEIIRRMETPSVPAFQHIGKVLMEYPSMVNEVCEFIERLYMSVCVLRSLLPN